MDLSELTSFVEAHPEDHDQRWRLAKKLYMDCEYRQALDHLVILRNEWRPRVNVTRYLAATYYRLGRYDEAMKELSTALRRWPQEVALKEQAARVYEVTDRISEALGEWHGIRDIDPDHPMVARAIQRLEALLSDEAPDEIPIGDSDSGIDIGGLVCAVCGAQNSIEFSRCWQCHATLDDRAAAATPAPHSTSSPRTRTEEPREGILLPILIAAGVVVALDIFLTLNNLSNLNFTSDRAPVLSLRIALEHEFAVTRIGIGCGLMLLWPIAIWVALKTIDAEELASIFVPTVTGLLAASMTYLTTFAPGFWFWLAPVVGAAASFALMVYCIRGDFLRVVAAWALQGVLVAAVVLVGVVAFNGFGPVRDVVALVKFAAKHSSDDEIGLHQAPDLVANRPIQVAWEPSGSRWLDSLGFKVRFVVIEAPLDKPLYIELYDDQRVIAGRNIDSARVEFTESAIVPGNRYRLILTGPDGTPPVTIRIYSLHRPVF